MFVFSLSSIFGFTQLFTPFHFFSALLGILVLISFSPVKVNPHWKDKNETNFYWKFKSCWLGTASLWRAFWPFFIFVNLAFFYIDYRVTHNTYTISSWRTVHVMLFFPTIWWLISIWNCSNNTRSRIWPICYKTLAIYYVIDYCLRLIMSYQYPHILFDCRLLLMELGECF